MQKQEERGFVCLFVLRIGTIETCLWSEGRKQEESEGSEMKGQDDGWSQVTEDGWVKGTEISGELFYKKTEGFFLWDRTKGGTHIYWPREHQGKGKEIKQPFPWTSRKCTQYLVTLSLGKRTHWLTELWMCHELQSLIINYYITNQQPNQDGAVLSVII